MEGLAFRRWNPGFVALRWRHLFWMLPLLGLLAGCVWFLFLQLKETSTSGTIGYFSGDGSTTNHEETAREGADFMTSRRVLENAANRAARSQLWGMDANVDAIRSRQKVEIDSTMGMPVIRMTVTGRGEKGAHETWMAIYNAAWEVAAKEQRELEQTQLDAAKGKVIRLEAEIAALEVDSSDKLPGRPDVNVVKLEVEGARKEQKWLEAGQLCGTSFFERVALISPPHLATRAVPFGPAEMLAMHGAVGFGAGLFGAVFIAYLLEFLKPRRVVALSAIRVDGNDF